MYMYMYKQCIQLSIGTCPTCIYHLRITDQLPLLELLQLSLPQLLSSLQCPQCLPHAVLNGGHLTEHAWPSLCRLVHPQPARGHGLAEPHLGVGNTLLQYGCTCHNNIIQSLHHSPMWGWTHYGGTKHLHVNVYMYTAVANNAYTKCCHTSPLTTYSVSWAELYVCACSCM